MRRRKSVRGAHSGNCPEMRYGTTRGGDYGDCHVGGQPGGLSGALRANRKQLGGLEAPAGGILHIAGPSPNGGWRVIEVFESEEDAGRFVKERFGPALEAVGFAGQRPQPQFWPVHNCMK